jgi:hypothetical protein
MYSASTSRVQIDRSELASRAALGIAGSTCSVALTTSCPTAAGSMNITR